MPRFGIAGPRAEEGTQAPKNGLACVSRGLKRMVEGAVREAVMVGCAPMHRGHG